MSSRLIFVFALLGLVAACASPGPAMTAREKIETKNRVFPGRTATEVSQAVRRTFELLDPTDVGFREMRAGIIANRSIGGVGTSTLATFMFEFDEGPDGVEVSLDIQSQATGEPLWEVETPFSYQVLWQRLDYLLGLSTEWDSCRTWIDRINEPIGTAWIHEVCSLADDMPPGRPLVRR